MYFLIQHGQIAGTIDDPTAKIPGFKIVEGIDLPAEQLYWDGAKIQERPERPSSLHYWQDNQWVMVESVIAQNASNWAGLVEGLRGTAAWAKTFSAAGRTLRANAAWTMLYGTLTTTHNLADLQFAVTEMRDAMIGISTIGDFAPEELTEINELLESNGFELRLE